MKRQALTDVELERIAFLTETKRWGADRIAADIGCHVGSVTWAQLRLGVDRDPMKPLPPVPTEPIAVKRGGHVVRRFTQAEDEQLLAYEAEGLSLNMIGRHLGRRHNSVVGRLRTLGRRQARMEAQGAAR